MQSIEESELRRLTDAQHWEVLDDCKQFLKKQDDLWKERESKEKVQIDYVADLDKKIEEFKDAFDQAQKATLMQVAAAFGVRMPSTKKPKALRKPKFIPQAIGLEEANLKIT